MSTTEMEAPHYTILKTPTFLLELQSYIGFRYTTQQFNVFIDYAPFRVITK